MRIHLVVCSILLAAILGFGWGKSVENRRDRDRLAAWQAERERLEVEAAPERVRLTEWLRFLHSQPDARRQVAARLSSGRPLEFQPEGDREIATWMHPDYGIQLELDFYQDKLVASSVHSGTFNLNAVHPQPPRTSLASPAESVRKVITQWGGWLWLAAFAIAVLSRRFGLVAAEAMLAIALACGAAWLVAPNYTLTLRGVFSNDPLVLAAAMYLASLFCLAFRIAQRTSRMGFPVRLQFRLRTLLALTAAVAMLLAMNAFGYVALGVLLIGAVIFFGAARLMHNPGAARAPGEALATQR